MSKDRIKDEVLTNLLAIKMYFHCALCLEELKKIEDKSPSDYVQIDAGLTVKGIQIWCKRHDCNIVHIDFEGQKHPANTSRKGAN